jgi:gas vesicle protein
MARNDLKHAAGFLFAGATVGAAIALLYVPRSGVRTRKDITKFARKTVDRLDDIQGDICHKVADWIDDMTEVIQDGVNRGKKLSADGYEQVLQGFDNARRCVDDGQRRIEQLINSE